MSGWHWQRVLVRISLLIGLLVSLYLAGRRGVAAWYFQEKSPETIQAAMRWDPNNPQYPSALATLTHFSTYNENPHEGVILFERAARLSPRDPQLWSDLGAAYDRAGDSNDALGAFQRAAELFPHSPEINWRLANFYIRTGKTQEGLQVLRELLVTGGVPRRDIFALAAKAVGNNNAILEDMLPPQTPVYVDYLDFQATTGDLDSAADVWSHLLALNAPFDPLQTFPFLDALIQHGDVEHLSEAWSAMAKRFPAKIGSLSAFPNLMKNGGFEADILNGGLDWRAVPVEGAIASVDSQVAFEGSRSLKIQFDGTQNVDYAHLFQYVPVHPNSQYQFSGCMRTDGITTDSGPRFQVLDAYDSRKNPMATANLLDTTDWTEERLEIKTQADTRLLVIRVARPPSEKFDNKIAGTVWIDRIRLTEAK